MSTPGSPDGPPPAEMPARIGRYEILGVLGTGGMATVYSALQTQPRRTVALKLMRDLPDAELALRRFRREIEILGRLRHPYVAQVFEAGMHEERGRILPWFAMEYVPGSTTITDWAEQRELSLRERLKLFVKVCAAVEHGHRHRIIHRDLKPANVLVDEHGDPKVIDFGVARGTESGAPGHTLATEEGHLVGTIQYMAPEQLAGEPVDLDARCDVYALGGLLYRLATGRRAHQLKGLPLLRAAEIIRNDDPPPPSRFAPEVRGDLETIILKALARDRTRRYGTAGELGRDLLRLLGDRPIKGRAASAGYRLRLFLRRHRTAAIAGGVVATILLAAAAGLFIQHRMLTKDEPAPGAGDRAAGDHVEAPPAVPTTAPPPPERTIAPAPQDLLLVGLTGPATAFAFAPEGDRLAGGNRRVALWPAGRAAPLVTTDDHDQPVRGLAFAGDLLVSWAEDGRIVAIHPEAGGLAWIVRHREGAILAAAVAQTGDAVALAGSDLLVRIIDPDGAELGVLRGTRGAFRALAWSPDGTTLAAGDDRGGVSLWRRDGTSLPRLEGRGAGAVAALAWSDSRLVATTATGRIRAWACDETGAVAADDAFDVDLPGTEGAEAPILAADAQWVLYTDATGLALCDLDDVAAEPRRLAHPRADDERPLALADGGAWIALAQPAGSVRVAQVGPGNRRE